MRCSKRILSLMLAAALCLAGAGQAQTGRLLDTMMANKCSKPDSALIKPGTVDTYNAQAKGFNDCLRVYVDNENNKIARLSADASGQFDAIMAAANAQIRDIERAINTAIIEAGIVNGVSQPSELPPPAESLAAFPAPECAKPDEALLKPPRGKKAASLAGLDTYEAQRQGHDACIRLSASPRPRTRSSRSRRFNAEAGFLRVARRGQSPHPCHQYRYGQPQALRRTCHQGVKVGRTRTPRVNAIHAPLKKAAAGLGPAQSQPGGVLASASLSAAARPAGAEACFRGQAGHRK